MLWWKIRTLSRELESKDAGQRMAAAVALGSLHHRKAVSPLVRALNTEDPLKQEELRVWLAVHASLERIRIYAEITGDAETVQLITDVLSHSNERRNRGETSASGKQAKPTTELTPTPGRPPDSQLDPAELPPLTEEKVRHSGHSELLEHLRMIAAATMSPSAKPPHLNSYEKRLATARIIGEELHRRGGIAAMRKALEVELGPIPGCRTIDQFWDGIGDWRG